MGLLLLLLPAVAAEDSLSLPLSPDPPTPPPGPDLGGPFPVLHVELSSLLSSSSLKVPDFWRALVVEDGGDGVFEVESSCWDEFCCC